MKKKVRDEVGYRDAYAPKNLFFFIKRRYSEREVVLRRDIFEYVDA